MSDLAAKRERLLQLFSSMQSCAVAFSGGVDSAVVAKAAQLALGDRAIAATGDSASLADGELKQARATAALIGIRHEVIATDEFADFHYTQNASDRCFHCKSELYTQLARRAPRWGAAVIVNGANLDDVDDYRPGMQAAADFQVRSPLVECEIDKEEVRELARQWELPVWDKPAAPCLSSRVAYGQEVTPQRLAMIDSAEQFLRGLGLKTVRVRYHEGDMARLEVPSEAIGRLSQPKLRGELVAHLKSLGFRCIALDLEGFRSGSLNALASLVTLQVDR